MASETVSQQPLSAAYLRREGVVHELVPLKHLRAGEFAEVAHVLGSADHVHRLEELGFRPGCVLRMVQPGSPCIVRMAGHTLCFRADDVTSVLVKPTLASHAEPAVAPGANT